MSEQPLEIETNHNFDKIHSTLKNVLIMEEFPDDKKVEILVEFMVVPRALNITISKK